MVTFSGAYSQSFYFEDQLFSFLSKVAELAQRSLHLCAPHNISVPGSGAEQFGECAYQPKQPFWNLRQLACRFESPNGKFSI